MKQVHRHRRHMWGVVLITLVLFLAACSTGGSAPAGNTAAPAPQNEPASGQSEQPAQPEPPAYPTKAITIVYHSKAGSGGDIFLRNLGKAMEKDLGQPVVIENRTGASGANAWMFVKDAKPDGYTLVGTSSTIISSPILTEMPVSYRDFTPVAQLFNDPQLLYVAKDAPWQTAAELLEYTKADPDKVTWGRSTPGSGDSIGLALLEQATGVKVQAVAFEGGSDVVVAVLGGHIHAALGEFSEIRGQVEAGEIKVLGAFTHERLPQLPDVPTMKEQGIDVTVFRPRAIMAPKGTPDYVVDRLLKAFEAAFKDPEFDAYWKTEGVIPEFVAKDEFMQRYDELNEFLQVLLKQ